MKIGELIKQLQTFNPDHEIMILDGFNGGGHPRTINLGPHTKTITRINQESTADCENIEVAVVIGYGCY